MPNRWTVERLGQMSADIVFKASGKKERFSVLLMSDEHADNLQADLGLIRKHHQEAVDLSAPILKLGDTFCAMEGKWDRRKSESHLRPEMRGGNYLDLLVNFHADLYGQYARNIAIISDGNHESSILNHHQTDLIERLVQALRHGGSPALHMPFMGFVRFRFVDKNKHCASWVLHYHHGYGGGGEVTRGLIDNSRTRGQYIFNGHYSGHIHRKNCDENVMLCLDHRGSAVEMRQLFLRGSCYKREHLDGNGYHIEKGRSARPLGGWWLHFDVWRGDNALHVTATAESAG